MAFAIGDRVRIKASKAEGYLLPMRKYAKEGRSMTVEGVAVDGGIRVRVDAKRGSNKSHSFVFWVGALDLESVQQQGAAA